MSVRTGCLSDRGCVLICSNIPKGKVRLASPAGEVIEREFQSTEDQAVVEIETPHRWWPNGLGPPTLYEMEIFDSGGRRVWSGSVGFKEVRWLPCEGAPNSAEPWVCEVNGRPVFLQGVNWTPASLDYLETKPDDIECLISLYKEMGCNLLRVWGGAFLESDTFYRAADRAGLMVWQEFPLSSSGIDNWPPENEAAVKKLELIATDFIRRRSHHPSLLLWCGGNELQGGIGSKIGIGRPVDISHPCLARLGEVVAREAPNIRFLPTSASGPRFTADAKEFGMGLHHDVHGPWNMETDLDAWRLYWQNDDALFRSETGMPGSMTAEQIRAYAGELNPWPPDENNLLWLHLSSWWRQLTEFEQQEPENSRNLETYCKWSRELQAEALGIAAAACKNRFPRCGGFLVWMGHDCHPCPANTSIIDVERNPKPAFQKLKSIFMA